MDFSTINQIAYIRQQEILRQAEQDRVYSLHKSGGFSLRALLQQVRLYRLYEQFRRRVMGDMLLPRQNDDPTVGQRSVPPLNCFPEKIGAFSAEKQ